MKGDPHHRLVTPLCGILALAALSGSIRAEDAADEGRWWSFRPVAAPELPSVRDGGWAWDPLDRFVLAALEARDMKPAPPADRRTLIRRVTFDLIGLPPTPEEIEAFVSDESPDAFSRVVDRLLASPHHGERWGRHWLDVVRYADTSGCNGDFPVPEAYRYRNWVIESFNADRPYDRFVREQIAGDLLPADDEARRLDRIVATGYLAISRRFSSLGEEFHLTLDDTIDNFGKAFLGLSISCARCHEHKFDPIPQEDYYALYGIFQSSRYSFPGTEIYRHTQDLVPLVSGERMKELGPALRRMKELDAEIFGVYTRMAEQDTGKEKNELRGRWQSLQKQRDELIRSLPEFPRAYGAGEGEPSDARVHIKGEPERLGEEVPRGFLQLLGGQRLPPGERASGRRQLAAWLTEPRNPLTARVLVNRVWQHHFGHGIVHTPNDFGTRGERPTHPRLLDHLSARFLRDGWSLKSMHRHVLLSRSYRMASVKNEEYSRRDPENRWLWSFHRRRLEAEEIRDAMLAVSGALDRSVGGPHPFKPEWEWRYTQHHPFVDDFSTRQRAVYLMQQRIRQQPFLATFDGADTNAATGLRKVSTSPQQALFWLNGEFTHEQAGAFAERIAREGSSPRERLDRAFRLALARPPSDEEVREGLDFLRELERPLEEAGVPPPERARRAWSSYLRVLMSTNEFEFVD